VAQKAKAAQSKRARNPPVVSAWPIDAGQKPFETVKPGALGHVRWASALSIFLSVLY
jgi:hypothetical protein